MRGNAGVASERQEYWLLFSNLFVALAAGALASWSAPMMLAILYIDIWLLANPHIVATYTRISSISSHVRIYWGLVAVAPFLVLVGLTIVALAYEAAGLFALYFLLQAFHVSRQSYGIARRHDRRPYAPRYGLPYLLIYLLPAWGYLHRSAQAPNRFLGYPIWMPPIAEELVYAIGIAVSIAVLFWLVRLGYSKGIGRANGLFNSFVLSHLLISLVGYVWINDITVGWLVVNVWHNIQYLIFVCRQQRPGAMPKKYDMESRKTPAYRKALVVISRTPAIFLLKCSVCGAILYVGANIVGESLLWLGLPTILIAHFVLNFHHYLADSIVWKRRRERVPEDIADS